MVSQSRESTSIFGPGEGIPELKPEPCCGAQPLNSSADPGRCFEAGVDLFDLDGTFSAISWIHRDYRAYSVGQKVVLLPSNEHTVVGGG